VANVLRGSDAQQVAARGHGSLSTFGLLREASNEEVRGYIDQLLSAGLLQQSDDVYPVLRLTSAGVELMKDAAAVPGLSLARQRRIERRPLAGRGGGRARIEIESWEGVDRGVFDRLRALRLRLARARSVPPYVIFHDTTLRELARVRPQTLHDLAGIRGMGDRKIETFGREVLETLAGTEH